jgi:hypothetical protein
MPGTVIRVEKLGQGQNLPTRSGKFIGESQCRKPEAWSEEDHLGKKTQQKKYPAGSKN